MLAGRLPEIAFAAALCVAGVAGLLADTRALAAIPGMALADAPRSAGLALTSREGALFRCDAAMTDPGFSLQAELPRNAVARACADLAALVLRDAPSHGFAHFIAAVAAQARGTAGRVALHLTASQHFAPHEGWLAERRFLLIGQAEPALRARLLPKEVAVLLTTQPGAEMLAGSLVGPLAAAPIRVIVLAEADKASAADRQRLLNILKRQAGGA
ncbi:MAG: hypothetical protein WBN04_09435 [Paracoccaceae bacterium]